MSILVVLMVYSYRCTETPHSIKVVLCMEEISVFTIARCEKRSFLMIDHLQPNTIVS